MNEPGELLRMADHPPFGVGFVVTERVVEDTMGALSTLRVLREIDAARRAALMNRVADPMDAFWTTNDLSYLAGVAWTVSQWGDTFPEWGRHVGHTLAVERRQLGALAAATAIETSMERLTISSTGEIAKIVRDRAAALDGSAAQEYRLADRPDVRSAAATMLSSDQPEIIATAMMQTLCEQAAGQPLDAAADWAKRFVAHRTVQDGMNLAASPYDVPAALGEASEWAQGVVTAAMETARAPEDRCRYVEGVQQVLAYAGIAIAEAPHTPEV